MDYLINLWNNLIDKLEKMGFKKILLMILGIITAFTIILIMSRFIQNKIIEDKVKNKTYSSMADFESVQEVIIYKGCKYIEEKKSTDSNYSEDIYLNFNRDLYNDGISSQGFFNDLVCYIAYVLEYENYRLIDESRDIVIEVICDKENKNVSNMIINGDKDYFGHMDSKNSSNNKEKISEINLNIQSNEINRLISNTWKTGTLNLGQRDSIFQKYEIYGEKGIEIRNVGTKVYNIVFTNNYKNEIVNGIKVGEELETIKGILGTPAFDENYIIGYKSKDIYVFFTSNEVSVYRTEDQVNSDLEELMQEYDEQDINKFINKLTDKWPDYDEQVMNDAYMYITYSLKGVRFQYNLSNRQGFILYNNYPENISAEEYENVYIDNSKNSVFLSEKNRVSKINDYMYQCGLKEENDKKESLNKKVSNVFHYTNLKENNLNKIIFINKENDSYKYAIDEDVESYLWVNDYKFLYSIKNRGIYLLNLQDNKTKTIKEGNETYTFKEYSDGYLTYDNGKIKLE